MSGLAGLGACSDEGDDSTKPKSAYSIQVKGGDKSPTDILSEKLGQVESTYDVIHNNSITSDEAKAISSRLHTLNASNSINANAERKALAATLAGEIIDDADSVYGHNLVKHSGDIDTLLGASDAAFNKKVKDAYYTNELDRELDAISIDQSEPEKIIPELQKDGVPIPKGFIDLAYREDAADALTGIYDVTSYEGATEDLESSPLREVKDLLRAYGDVEKAQEICDKYSYGGIDKATAFKLLAGIKSIKVVDATKNYIKAHDANDYDATQSARTDVYDVKDGVESDVYKFIDDTDNQQAAFRGKSQEFEDSLDVQKYNAWDSLTKSVTKALKKANEHVEPVELKKFPKLQHGASPIDFSDVSSDKKVDLNNSAATSTYDQFAELYGSQTGEVLHFDSSAKIGEKQKQQITSIMKTLSPLTSAALEGGALLNIRFLVNTDHSGANDFDFNPYYDNVNKTIIFTLPRNKSVSEDIFRTALIHELTHALISDAYFNDHATQKEVNDMKAACSALSNEARSQFEMSVESAMSSLDSLIQTTHGEDQKLFEKLKSVIEKNDINEVVDNDSHKNSTTISWGCESPYLGDVFYGLAIATHYKGKDDAGFDYSDFQTRYENNDDFNRLVFTWYTAIQEYSLYARFNESDHVEGDSQVKPRLGHSEDILSSGTEMPASLTSALLGHQDKMADLYDNSNASEKHTIKLALVAVIRLISNRYPNLKSQLRRAYDAVVRQS